MANYSCRFCGSLAPARWRLAEHLLGHHRAQLPAWEQAQERGRLSQVVLTASQVGLLQVGLRQVLTDQGGHLGHSLRVLVSRHWFAPQLQRRGAPGDGPYAYRLTPLGALVFDAWRQKVAEVEAAHRAAPQEGAAWPLR